MTITEYKEIVAYLQDCIKGSDFENHTFVVGGAVRDFLMHNPIKDIDLVVSIPNGGLKFAKWMEENGYTVGSVVTYPTYGTAMFKLAAYPDIELECVQTRGEQYHDKNSRNPETCFATIEDDAFRRDLTINAVYHNISTGEILDITGKSLDDIKNHVIRCTNDNPNVVFMDDPLRLLRVCRFSARYGWKIEKETYMSMIRNVARLEIITKERIQDELMKILTCKNPVMGLEELEDIGALKYVIPELEETVGMEQNKYHFGDVWEHTLRVVENASKMVVENDYDKQVLMMAALLHDIGKIKTRSEKDGKVHFLFHEVEGAKLAEEIMRRLKFSNDFISRVSFLVREHMRFKSFGDEVPSDKALRKFQYLCKDKELFKLCAYLMHADNMAHAEEYCLPNQCRKILERSEELEKNGESMFGYKLPINGYDIMKIKGIDSGPDIKKCQDYLIKLAYNGVGKLDKTRCIQMVKSFNPQKS